jgi:L-aminopeptidase/D-esterase-like protein
MKRFLPLLSILAAGLTVCAATIVPVAAGQTPDTTVDRGLTSVGGIKVGHHTLAGRPTGCTVVLAEAGAVAGVDVRGSAPGTRETDLLKPTSLVDQVHAIVFAGGSAFGLDAASGVMRFLDERKIGFATSGGPVPIVPAAVIFDLEVGAPPTVRPTADCGYVAASEASDGPVQQGSVGAGAGASIGKILGQDRAMKGGVGSASITLPNGLVVGALVVVNALGDVVNPATGRVIAGVRTADGRALADARRILRDGATLKPRLGGNTTLAVVATNARLTKTQATKVAEMAHDGLARAISPVHSMYDGDTVFALATGTHAEAADITLVGALAADVVAEAIQQAVRQATGLPGLPAVRDLPPGR